MNTLACTLLCILVLCGPVRADAVVTLAVVGDVLLGRGVGKAIEKHGPDHPFSGVESVISGADLAFCNLECALSDRGVPRHDKYALRGKPQLAMLMARAGFDVVSLANNHTSDFGPEALSDTTAAVRRAGMAAVGSGPVQVLTRRGLRVGFLAYSDLPVSVDIARLGPEVARARSKCDVLVVSMHWGEEYMKQPTERQRELARAAIDSGADMVVGHHPHVLQPTETYRGKPIIYSAGAFVWDSRIFGANKSGIYIVNLGKASARLARTIPVEIVACRPRRCKR